MSNKNLPDLNLEVGDIVEAFGVRGIVESERFLSNGTDIECKLYEIRFEKDNKISFYSDGKLNYWHKTPSLKLIEKKNKPIEAPTTHIVTFTCDGYIARGGKIVYFRKGETVTIYPGEVFIACSRIKTDQ